MIPIEVLSAAALCTAKPKDGRPSLLNVFVDDVAVRATNGHVLIEIPTKTGVPEGKTVPVPAETIKTVEKLAGSASKRLGSPVSIDYDFEARRGSLTVERTQISVPFVEDAQPPPWKGVWESLPGKITGPIIWDAKYLALMDKIHRTLGLKMGGWMLLEADGEGYAPSLWKSDTSAFNVSLIIMPMRRD